MRDKTIFAIFGGNVSLLFANIEGFLKLGTSIAAFLASSVSLCLLVYKERDNIKAILKIPKNK